MPASTPLRQPPRLFKKASSGYNIQGVLLYLLPSLAIPAVIKAFIQGHLLNIAVNAGCYALYLLAAQLLRRGLSAERAYQEKRVSLAPKWPLKTLAAVLVAVSTFLLAWLGAQNPLNVSLAFAVGAFLGMYLSYGFDPRKAKTISGNHGYSTEEIVQTIDAANELITQIEYANSQIRNHEFNTRIQTICSTAHAIVAELEANPSAIRRSRKFLLVYLQGTEKVTTGYAATHLQAADNSELEQNFRNALDAIDKVFKEQQEKLLHEDLFDLDVQIEVLTTRLRQEGVI